MYAESQMQNDVLKEALGIEAAVRHWSEHKAERGKAVSA